MANQLTTHFSYVEMTTTKTGLINRPPPQALSNLVYLCEMVLEPIHSHWGRLKIDSGYRSGEVNQLIGGAPGSQHMKGEAADIVPLDLAPAGATIADVFAWLIETSAILFDQAIYYPNHGFIHVSCAPGREPRRMALVSGDAITGRRTYRPYQPGEFS